MINWTHAFSLTMGPHAGPTLHARAARRAAPRLLAAWWPLSLVAAYWLQQSTPSSRTSRRTS